MLFEATVYCCTFLLLEEQPLKKISSSLSVLGLLRIDAGKHMHLLNLKRVAGQITSFSRASLDF